MTTQAAFDLPFLGEQIDWRGGRAIWITCRPLRYTGPLLGGRTLVIPDEFLTDHASVPRLPITYAIAGGRGIRSATIHDFAYQFGFWWLVDGTKLTVARSLVDGVFHESLVADPISGVGRVIAWEMWLGVRAFGSGHWATEERVTRLNPVWWAAHRSTPQQLA